MIDKNNQCLSVRSQSKLLSLNRSILYKKSENRTDDTILSNMVAENYTNYPMYGYRRITAILRRQGLHVNHKRVQRLMQEMNLQAIYPKPNTSKKLQGNLIYPYLLADLVINKANQVLQVDITYLRTDCGFMYLVALIDVYSRMVMGWRLSNDLCVSSCIDALEDVILHYNKPKIINSDQGSQFTSDAWVSTLLKYNIAISMTGKGRCNDNANIERLWRAFKYEGSYLYKWNSVAELKLNIPKWVGWYNFERPHQALKYRTPFEVYSESTGKGNSENLQNLYFTQQVQSLPNHNLIL